MSNACDCYEVIEAGSINALHGLVHEKICAGKVPLGGVAVVPRKDAMGFIVPIYLQTVCSPAALVNPSMIKGGLAAVNEALRSPPRTSRRRKSRRGRS